LNTANEKSLQKQTIVSAEEKLKSNDAHIARSNKVLFSTASKNADM
jgi:hypothetical protein